MIAASGMDAERFGVPPAASGRKQSHLKTGNCRKFFAVRRTDAPSVVNAGALERYLRRRQRRRRSGKSPRARRRCRRRSVRCSLDQVGAHQGPARGNIHRRAVRPREQGPDPVAGSHRDPGCPEVVTKRLCPPARPLRLNQTVVHVGQAGYLVRQNGHRPTAAVSPGGAP